MMNEERGCHAVYYAVCCDGGVAYSMRCSTGDEGQGREKRGYGSAMGAKIVQIAPVHPAVVSFADAYCCVSVQALA